MNAMLITCACEQCGGHLEFAEDEFTESGRTSSRILGQMIRCPHCETETIVYKPLRLPPEFRATPRSNLISCPSCGNQISRAAASCPQCGHTFKQPGAVNLSDPVHILGLILCAGFIVLVIGYVIFMASH